MNEMSSRGRIFAPHPSCRPSGRSPQLRSVVEPSFCLSAVRISADQSGNAVGHGVRSNRMETVSPKKKLLTVGELHAQAPSGVTRTYPGIAIESGIFLMKQSALSLYICPNARGSSKAPSDRSVGLGSYSHVLE